MSTIKVDTISNLVESAVVDVSDIATKSVDIASKVSSASLSGNSGASLVGYMPAGVGAVATDVQAKQRERVSVYDFMTSTQITAAKAGDVTLDVTESFTAAQGTTGYRKIRVPAGKYKVTGLRYLPGVIFEGDGFYSTYLQQGSSAQTCVYVKSDATTGQLYGCGLLDLTVLGTNTIGATSAVKLEAISPYTVQFGEWKFAVGGPGMVASEKVSTALELVMGAENEVYSNKFDVMCWGSTGTAFITGGFYNSYRLEAVQSNIADTIFDNSLNSTFHYLVGDGQFFLGGQNNTFLNPTIETITGAPVNGPSGSFSMDIAGYGHTIIDPCLTSVTDASINYGFRVQNQHTILNPKMFASTCRYPMFLVAGSSGVIANFQANNTASQSIAPDSTLRNWQFLGDNSTSFPSCDFQGSTFTPVLSFGGASVGITYTVQQGMFQRVGNVVHFNVCLSLGSKGSSVGAVSIAGLPFPARIVTNAYQPFSIYLENIVTPGSYVIYANTASGQSTISLIYAGVGSAALSDTQFANNSIVRISGSYFV